MIEKEGCLKIYKIYLRFKIWKTANNVQKIEYQHYSIEILSYKYAKEYYSLSN